VDRLSLKHIKLGQLVISAWHRHLGNSAFSALAQALADLTSDPTLDPAERR
jgi:hypothetical protein